MDFEKIKTIAVVGLSDKLEKNVCSKNTKNISLSKMAPVEYRGHFCATGSRTAPLKRGNLVN